MIQRITFFALFFAFVALGQSVFPLDSIFARGDSCLRIVWTLTFANVRIGWYSRCCFGDVNYVHCDFLEGQEYRGIAYSYGGEDNYRVFRQRLAQGLLAGSHDCHYRNCGDPSDSVTGTDCSGFVCYAWSVGRQATGGLATNKSYLPVAFDSLKAGDILVKGSSHTVLVVDVSEYPSVLIWESYGWPVNGCRERIVNLKETYWGSYVGRRKPGLYPMAVVGGQGAGASEQIRLSIQSLARTLQQPNTIASIQDALGRVQRIKSPGQLRALPAGIYSVSVTGAGTNLCGRMAIVP